MNKYYTLRDIDNGCNIAVIIGKESSNKTMTAVKKALLEHYRVTKTAKLGKLSEHILGSNPLGKSEMPFLQGHVLNGEIEAQGEDIADRWKLVVTNNAVSVVEAKNIKGANEQLLDALKELAVQADEAVPTDSRSRHFENALDDALALIDELEGK